MKSQRMAAAARKLPLAICLAALLTGGLMAYGVTAVAQQSQQQQPAQTDFDRDTLESFAAAAVEVSQIQEEYSQRLDNVSEREQANALQQEANQEMLQAIQANGIDVETYNAVARATRHDQEVRETVNRLMDQLAQASSS